ncbi:MAG: bifunctional NADP-dependent methylenetetrahydromethanopterin dehydrogenase/methylenetetrahydrofolate dehydrogenase, partial [Planctomycetota bacterium]
MKSILIQFDTDALPSVFDRVVAVDSNVEHLFSYGGVTPENVVGLVHGAIFTRGPADLKNTAIFVGGSDVAAGEVLFKRIQKTFFGPMRVSVMMDSNGCNTTAAAAIASARKHLSLADASAIVLGATGPVGLRAAELLALENSRVTLVS